VSLKGYYSFSYYQDRRINLTNKGCIILHIALLYNLKAKGLAHKHAADAMELVDRLTSRLIRRAVDNKKTLIRFKIARIRSLLSAEGKRFLDSRNIRIDDVLSDALTDWEASGGKMAYEDTTSIPKCSHDHTDKPFGVTCFTCGNVGHKAANRRYKPKTVSEFIKAITCYLCGEEGHMSLSCPDKSFIKNSVRNSGKQSKIQALVPSSCKRENPTL